MDQEAPVVTPPSGIQTSTLLIADISSYTSFLEGVQKAHPEMNQPDGTAAPAYRVLSGLLDTVMLHIAPTFTLLQVEGDALFARDEGPHTTGTAGDLVDLVRSSYAAFRERVQYAMDHDRCECGMCMVLPTLELKFIVHRGPVVPQRIAGRDLLAGPAVNLTHRLLKNSITDRTGLRAYLFVTHAATQALGVTSESGMPYTENYPDTAVSGILIALAAARPAHPRATAG